MRLPGTGRDEPVREPAARPAASARRCGTAARAEALLSGGGPLAGVLAALPDEAAAAKLLNAILAETGATPRLRWHGSGWRIVTLGGSRGSDQLAAAATELAELVAADGWRRVKRCAASGCRAGFVDGTNAASRRYCRAHSRHPGPAA